MWFFVVVKILERPSGEFKNTSYVFRYVCRNEANSSFPLRTDFRNSFKLIIIFLLFYLQSPMIGVDSLHHYMHREALRDDF